MKNQTSKSTSKRQPRTTKTAPCPICGQVCNVMGLTNHIRLKHKTRLKTRIVDVPRNDIEAQAAHLISAAVQDSVTIALEAQTRHYTPEEIAENRRKFFDPSTITNWAAEWLKYYRRYPDRAQGDWDALMERDKRAPFASHIGEDKRYALKCVLKIDGHSDGE